MNENRRGDPIEIAPSFEEVSKQSPELVGLISNLLKTIYEPKKGEKGWDELSPEKQNYFVLFAFRLVKEMAIVENLAGKLREELAKEMGIPQEALPEMQVSFQDVIKLSRESELRMYSGEVPTIEDIEKPGVMHRPS